MQSLLSSWKKLHSSKGVLRWQKEGYLRTLIPESFIENAVFIFFSIHLFKNHYSLKSEGKTEISNVSLYSKVKKSLCVKSQFSSTTCLVRRSFSSFSCQRKSKPLTLEMRERVTFFYPILMLRICVVSNFTFLTKLKKKHRLLHFANKPFFGLCLTLI